MSSGSKRIKRRKYPSIAIRQRRLPSDAFFHDGNDITLKECSSSSHVIHYINYCNTNKDNDFILDKEEHVYKCDVKGCRFKCMSYLSYEEHYWNHHMHVCSLCLEEGVKKDCKSKCRSFTSEFLLDLHINEMHGGLLSLFDKKSVNYHGKYRCLEEDCTCSQIWFESDEQRLEHMRSVHGYPRWFRFNPQQMQQRRKSKRGKIQKSEQVGKKEEIHSQTDQDMCVIVPEEITHQQQMRKSSKSDSAATTRAARKQRQKEKRSSIPCKFFTSDRGCWRGEKCMFLHSRSEPITSQNEVANTTIDMDVDEVLVDQLKHTRISLPETLTFGRRRNR